ncbi:MAG TPA: Gfo/Idh/MocA family oxidoreductase [Gemmatimonadaceae bacterium]|nr:Gfo/Idh/MocA family oxidoreductase [Gemmatimonadaceae bacterium]
MRVGVAGAGALGYHHVRLLRDLAGATCVGFYDNNAAVATHVASELGVTAHPSLDALIDACDALCVVVPTTAHAAVAQAAIAKGKHLLVEKPLCATLDEADALLSAAKRAGVLVQTGHIERFNRAVRAALPYVDTPRFISSDRLAPFNPRGTEVAVVLDLMIHDIDLILTLTRRAVSDVQAVGVPVLTRSADIANARLAFADGAVATITASRVSREKMRKLRVFQQSGYLSLDLASGGGEFYRLRDGIDPEKIATGPQSLEAFVEFIPLSAPEGEPLKLELQSFVDAIHGRAPVVVSGQDGRDALAVAHRIMEAIDASLAQTGAPSRTAGARSA